MSELFSDDVYPDQLYSERQSRILVTIPRFSGSLSVLGSTAIIYIILKDHKKKLRRLYHRLLLTFSFFDVVTSINYALASVVVPKNTPGVWGASGTVATCEASGFVMRFSFALGVYGTFLCVYHLLVLRYRIREQTLATRVEPVVHTLAIGYPVVMGSIALRKNLYNPGNVSVGFCFLNCFPMDCLRNEDIECERGEDYAGWAAVHGCFFVFFFVVVIVSSVLTAQTVRRRELEGQRWSISNASSRVRIKESVIQASLYVVAFFVTYSGYGLQLVIGRKSDAIKENRTMFFALSTYIRIFLPIQGFWNFFIYVRPRYNEIRRRRPEMSAFSILHAVLTGVSMATFLTPRAVDRVSPNFSFPGVNGSVGSVDGAHDIDRGLSTVDEETVAIDDFYTPEIEASGLLNHKQRRLSMDHSESIVESVESSDVCNEIVSLQHAKGQVAATTAQERLAK